MFKPTKIGLLNFWLYDEEEFSFFDGKLLLRGENGSGKSVTMQSFIPLILDGNKSPKRLDTFGSSDKHIEYYLLGENNEKEDSTGYLYMEFCNTDTSEYITIGMGLRARTGKNTDFFGFALKDGRRVNHDFFLYKCQDGLHKTPLTKLELKAALGTQNGFVETTKDYKKMVNDLLFQFPNIDSYDEFIQVLIQLRSPKLSKEFKPTKLMTVLNDVLPPLADSDLRPLSDTIESLNQTREKMEELQNTIKTIGNFVKVMQNYNETILYQKAALYLNQIKERKDLMDSIHSKEKKIKSFQVELEHLKEQATALDDEYTKAKFEKEQLGNQDLEEKTRRKLELEKEIKDFSLKIEQEESNLDLLKQKLALLKDATGKLEQELSELLQEQTDVTTEILDLSSEMQMEDFLNVFQTEQKNFDYFYSILKEKEEEIVTVLALLEKKEKLLEEQNRESDTFEELKKQYEHLENDKNDLYQELEQEQTIFFDSLRYLMQHNKYLTIDETDYRSMVTTLEEYTKENYQQIVLKYDELFQNSYATVTMDLASSKSKKEQIVERLQEEQTKLETLLNEKEITFQEMELQEESIAFLKEQNIPYLSFYQAVEFVEGLSEDVCNRLEESLYSSGILNAKILKTQDISKLKNKNISYLVPSSKKKENLTKYLKPSLNDIFDEEYIKQILESISISDKDPLWINETSFQFDFFKGQTAQQYESKFIGELLRKKRHEEDVRAQEEVVRGWMEELNAVEQGIKTLEQNIAGLIEEHNKFPDNRDLENVAEQILKNELERQFLHEKQNQVEEKIREFQKQIEMILLELEDYRGVYPLRLDIYRNAKENLGKLKEAVQSLELVMDKIHSKREVLDTQKAREEDITHSYDNTYGILLDYVEQKKKCGIEFDSISALLNTREYQELGNKLNALMKIIDDYSDKKGDLLKRIGGLEQTIAQEQTDFDEKQKNLQQLTLYEEIYFAIFKEELGLGYVKNEEATEEVANAILREFKNQNRDISTATANYYRAYNEYRQDLLDYAISDVPLFDERETLIDSYVQKGLDSDTVREIYQKAKRQDIVTSYQGKKLNLFALQDALKESYEADQIYLDEQDRHLFEDILLRTIGGKIKEKIIDAKEWVKNINQIMALKQKDSALSFYLEWRPKSQETLEEMNTKELVDIFMLDEGQANPSDTDRLVKHFRSKIKRAEEFMDESHDSYFDMIFGILDYRNWFQFKLYYRKNESEKKELTDKIFSVFSGGEKAKTMYVPLFASVYAKLDSASSSAPRLIALDEAFAGVDEKNIEEMFALLDSFDLDYILTSQALWCDYKEIKEISICELIKARDASSVAIRRYRWNGLVREVLN